MPHAAAYHAHAEGVGVEVTAQSDGHPCAEQEEDVLNVALAHEWPGA